MPLEALTSHSDVLRDNDGRPIALADPDSHTLIQRYMKQHGSELDRDFPGQYVVVTAEGPIRAGDSSIYIWASQEVNRTGIVNEVYHPKPTRNTTKKE